MASIPELHRDLMWQDGSWAGSLCSCSLWFPINTRSLSLPRHKARKAPICTRCDDRETCVCNRCSAKSLPCRVAWKATICAKHKGWQAPTHAGRDDREETTKSLPCRVAWKATICAKRKGWQAPTHAGRDDRENTAQKWPCLPRQQLAASSLPG